MRPLLVIVSLAALVAGAFYLRPASDLGSSPSVPPSLDAAGATRLMNRQPGFFIPNLGQWGHAARFVHRSGPMTLFLEDRGWVIDLVERPVETVNSPHEPDHYSRPGDGKADQKIHGVALRMTFEGDACMPEIVGEKKMPGHHNYFLGNDESHWRTHVPLYSSVLYQNLYPGIDLRLREMNGVPEYDLLLEPGADLTALVVHVEGAKGLSIAGDGSLVIETALGPLIQSVPVTWEVSRDGRKRDVACELTLLGTDRFGFEATGWDGNTSLTIDPGVIWLRLLAGGHHEEVEALFVDGGGVVTLAGWTQSTNYPTTSGAYDTTYNGLGDLLVSRLDPGKTGFPQLVYSTFLGGSTGDLAYALAVDARGTVTVAGTTGSTDFPITSGAYDTTYGGGTYGGDAFVSRLDPSKTGKAQLVYSTFLGGSGSDAANALAVDGNGVVTVAGDTRSRNFPTTSGAYDTTHNGVEDVFVSRLDPGKIGTAQLVFSTLLGGSMNDYVHALAVGTGGTVTVAGQALSKDFPTTSGAYNTTLIGGFVSRLDPSKSGAAQLVYSTLLQSARAYGLAVDAGGVVTVTGETIDPNFPTTSGAYDTTYNGYWDVFVTRLDPSKIGAAQLVYSTFLGGRRIDIAHALSVDASGVITVAGETLSSNFPTTSDAYDRTNNGGYGDPWDVFVSRLDLSRTGSAQLIYSTYLGGGGSDFGNALSVDASGVATVAGYVWGNDAAFAIRVDMGVALYGDGHEISIKAGGTQRLTVHAGKAHANRSYWIFGSETGTRPGIDLLGVHIPLNPDLYTIIAMGAVNGREFTNFRGTLDANGLATASVNIPANLAFGFTFHHAYVVYDASGKIHMASNAVPVRLK
jgi:hypothetical protein